MSPAALQAGSPVYLVFHRGDLRKRLGALTDIVVNKECELVRLQCTLENASGAQLWLSKCA